MARRLRLFLALAVVVLATTGCPVLAEDQVEEFPLLIRGNVRSIEFVPEDQFGLREVLDGRWTSATELRVGAADADALGIPQRVPMVLSVPPGAPNLNVNIETAWLVNDIGTSAEYCVVEAVVLVDQTQGSEHTVADAGGCFDTSISFDLAAEVLREE